MVELLQALAWAVKVEETARAKVSNSSEMRGFILMPPEFFWEPIGSTKYVRILRLHPAGRNGELL